ncbi:SusD/RagB family nutrient-binding outer membrane lipoprotein [Mucilaginibacter flavus]|uniref:SusD/RagB family nutrient-binding outer membrane lipoprotein n=1 Tax=Mucilaginibacter flavus TaxID=931504 RepID=UPI0025B38686|nr:SusD/RagB family nutrient-binding outer membrane lipoprotein [Mucilaginibacter flavus]MDN3582342.1 SusD/RagB family nutrient-binding outer membrane lipoprotein [Mucilaginibacter flavus]
MKKYFLAALLPILTLGACHKDLASLNTNPKLFPTVPTAALFTQAERVLTNTVTTSSVNTNIYRLIEQQWQETTYTDESNYIINTRNINGAEWNALYRDVLNNLRLAKTIVPTDVAITGADVQKNDIAILDILQVYSFYYLVTTFGDCPYTQAFDAKNNFPKYDDAATIYKDLLARLDADIAALNTGSTSFGAADLIYKGDVSKWKKFANSFKLKMAMTISDSDPATAKTTAAAAVAGGVFTSNADNATYAYASSTPNTNPVWVDIVQSGRFDYVACNTFVNYLNAHTDARVGKYFTALADGTYKGNDPGAKSNYDSFSHVNPTLTATTFPGLLLDYAEIAFYQAEAADKGYITGTPATYYAAGIQASFTYWGAGDATVYTAALPYSTANLAYQKWIADYNRGWDAWIETRRLDIPALVAPSTATSAFPVRFPYPIAESNVNGANYKAASAAIGGDLVTTKLFFDKH